MEEWEDGRIEGRAIEIKSLMFVNGAKSSIYDSSCLKYHEWRHLSHSDLPTFSSLALMDKLYFPGLCKF